MDKLHAEKIEIVSPTFMNQRRVDEKKFFPEQVVKETEPGDEKSPEDLIFDEAIKSEKLETKKDYLKEIDKKQALLKEKLKNSKDEKEIENIKSTIKANDEMKERIEKNIKEQIEKNKESEK